ncbi:hypothetical protein C1645_877469 [Glomus cerebriforme]|uniref:HTH myb-type domain-containing protein n=1 Tax=Glomus cerebriforme TaxID=658196 RepID=A0A397SQ73_9GLOM|nr:hypothetical protein C1645_877469 [Glomus cerebriforme]
MGRMKQTLFTKEIDNVIIELMKKWGHLPKPYVKIHEAIPQYTSKQIRQRWISILDPRLCRKSLDEDEKSFIIQWVEKNRQPNGTIHWKDLINEIEQISGKLRSENVIKNFWNQRRRKIYREKNIEYVIQSTHY